MKSRHTLRMALVLISISLGLTNCTFPVTTDPMLLLRVARPATGDVIMLGESMQIVANGSSTGGDVSRILFYANGSPVGDLANDYGATIVEEITWTPSAAGEYTLQVAARRGGDTAYSEVVKVCVLPFQIAAGHPIDIYAHEYDGDCVIPPRSGSAVPGTASVEHAGAGPSSLTYAPDFLESCRDQTRMLSFKFYLDDPNDDVVFAAVALKISPASGGRINSETTLALTRISALGLRAKKFIGSIDMHIFMYRSLTGRLGDGLSGEIEWTARGFGRDGTIVVSDGPHTIPVEPVNCDGTPYLPSASLSTIPTPTATPASEADCPPGTYFAPATNRCIPIQIVPADGGNDDGGCQPPPDGCGELHWYGEPFCFCFE